MTEISSSGILRDELYDRLVCDPRSMPSEYLPEGVSALWTAQPFDAAMAAYETAIDAKRGWIAVNQVSPQPLPTPERRRLEYQVDAYTLRYGAMVMAAIERVHAFEHPPEIESLAEHLPTARRILVPNLLNLARAAANRLPSGSIDVVFRRALLDAYHPLYNDDPTRHLITGKPQPSSGSRLLGSIDETQKRAAAAYAMREAEQRSHGPLHTLVSKERPPEYTDDPLSEFTLPVAGSPAIARIAEVALWRRWAGTRTDLPQEVRYVRDKRMVESMRPSEESGMKGLSHSVVRPYAEVRDAVDEYDASRRRVWRFPF